MGGKFITAAIIFFEIVVAIFLMEFLDSVRLMDANKTVVKQLQSSVETTKLEELSGVKIKGYDIIESIKVSDSIANSESDIQDSGATAKRWNIEIEYYVGGVKKTPVTIDANEEYKIINIEWVTESGIEKTKITLEVA